MAFPSVVTTNTTFDDTAGTNLSISYPSGITSGDLVIVKFGYGTTGLTLDWSSSDGIPITSGSIENVGGATEGIATGYRWVDGTEGTGITIISDIATRFEAQICRISGAENPSTQPPEADSSTVNNLPPDPPNLTPTGGAKDYLWIACGARTRSSADEDLATAPTNYGDFIVSANTLLGANFSTGGMAARQLNAASEDPGAFGGVGIIGESAAVTIAVYPLSVPTVIPKLRVIRNTQRW